MKQNQVLLIYTGGTIGMQATSQGLAPAVGLVSLLGTAIDESLPEATLELRFHSMEPLLDSADIGPNQWMKIANVIGQQRKEASRVVVLHGTDTMAYTGSALSYLLLGLSVPVILTGSQLPLDSPGSDALANVLGSLKCPADKGVSLYFNGRLMPANRSIKWDSEGFEAFKAPRKQVRKQTINHIRHDGKKWENSKVPHVVLYRVQPGEVWWEMSSWLEKPPQAIVLSVFGAGTLPQMSDKVVTGFLNLVAQGSLLMVISQCQKGQVQFSRYAASARLSELSIINGQDMTLEAAYTKLVVLFSLGYNTSKVRVLMGQNIAGEMLKERQIE